MHDVAGAEDTVARTARTARTGQSGGRSGRRSYVALGVGVGIVLLFTVLIRTAANPWVYLVGAAYGTALSVVGARRMPRARRRIWVAFAVAQGLFLAGDLLWTLYDNVFDVAPYPSWADALYLAMYPCLALGMWWLVRSRRRGRDRAAFLDAAILTTGVTVIALVFFIRPAAAAGGATMLSQVVGAAYPVGDLLLLAVAFRLLTAGIARNPALWALLASVSSLLVADLYYVATIVNDLSYPLWIDVAYLLSYVLLGFAAVHPSADDLSEPAPDRPDRITAARTSLLGVALVLVPATDLVARLTGFRHDSWVIFVGGCVAAVLVVLRLWDLVQDLQSKAAQVTALARTDALTGVPNRGTWDHELARACDFARESGASLSVAVLDMDHFKELNDTRGHLAGDLVLKETAAAWASILRGRGFLARYGGEEFTVLLPQHAAAEARPVLERMRRAVTHGQSCSIGVASWDGVESPAELVSRADEALYVAKRSGRDRIAVHDGAATVLVPSTPCRDLPSLRVVYQPIVDLATGEVVATEALSRFERENPRDVFDRAARDGTGPALEAAAVAMAVEGWQGDGLLSLNVSLTALVAPVVQEALPDDLTGLVFEITEADLVDYSPEVMLAIADLRARGGLIAIDDFGIGFSNVHRIATIKPDIAKLDMSLVRGIDQDPALQAVGAACMLYARLTGVRVVAEGIETPAERDCLSRLGVELGQGFLLGRPAPLASDVPT